MTRTDDFNNRVNNAIRSSIETKERLLASAEVVSTVARVSEVLVDAFKQKWVALFGNGGSAADAQHIAAEFVGRFAYDRPALPALALPVNTSCVTAIGNDYGFEVAFARQLEALGNPGDVAVGISTSGNSPNVICGLVTAGRLGLRTVALTGCAGAKIKDAASSACVCPRPRPLASRSVIFCWATSFLAG